MATPDRTNQPFTRDSEQSVLNKSQDPKYDVLAVELVAENPDGTAVNRVIANPDGSLAIGDATSQAIGQAVYDALVRLQPLQHDIPYARSNLDEMRVVIGSGGSVYVSQYFGNVNSAPLYHSSGAPSAYDAREQMAYQAETNFNTIRNQRWVIT